MGRIEPSMADETGLCSRDGKRQRVRPGRDRRPRGREDWRVGGRVVKRGRMGSRRRRRRHSQGLKTEAVERRACNQSRPFEAPYVGGERSKTN